VRGSRPKISEADIDTAHHEAGHAVCGFALGRFPLWATIEREGNVAGKTEFEPAVPSCAWRHFDDSAERRAYAEQRIVGELAGTAAHDLLRPGRTADVADECDLYWAKELIIDLVNWEDPDLYLEQAQLKARTIVKENRKWVVAVALALLERKTLSRDELLALKPDTP
jgi:ATP-dependent Zn protease